MAELDKFKRRIIRSVARMLLVEKKPESELWEVLRTETGCDCRKLWDRMRGLTLKKLKRLLAADDKVDNIIPIAQMTLTDWLLFDLVLVHDDVEVIGQDTPPATVVKPLEDLFDIVDEYEIESKVGEPLADAWTAATFAYNKMGRQCSPMLLQRRWYQMKRKARARFYKFWYSYRGNSKLLVNAKTLMPNKLEMAIAQRYPHVVTKPFLEWNQLIENKSVILPDEFEKKINSYSQLPAPKGDSTEPDIVLLEPNIETIDLGDADSEPDSPEEGSDVAKKTEDSNADSEIPMKEVVVKTEPLDDIETYSESLDDSLKEINRRLLESVPNIDDYEEDANCNMETNNLDETSIENDSIGTTTKNVTTDMDANIENDNNDVNTEDDPVIFNTDQTSEDENENNISETGTEDHSNVIKTENEITVDHTGSNVDENSNSENNVTEELQQTVCSDVNVIGIYLETVAKDPPEISESEISEMVMPQITNVFGNVNVATDVLIKMSNMSRDAKQRIQSPNPVLASVVDNVLNEPIEVGDDDDEVNDKLEAYLNSSKDTKQKEIEPVDSNIVQQDKDTTKQEEETKEIKDIKPFMDISVDLTFADDGIELVDDGIEYEDEDYDDIIKPIGEIHLKQELDTAIKSKTENKESNEGEENLKFDLKLLMQPVVFTTKLEDMTVFKDIDVDCVSDINILDNALIESKPVVITQQNIKNEIEAKFNTSLHLTSDGIKHCDDSPSEDEMSEPDELPIEKRVKLSSYVLQKPKSRSYNPIQLCKNPDFNTRLKRLTACFLSSMRNRSFLKTLKPMTIDLSKAFESKLIAGTLYLESESEDSTLLIEEVKDNSEQATSILPSAMPVQSLIDNLIEQSVFRSTTSEPNVSPKPSRDTTDLPERSKVINLPDIDNIRRMNQRLFTAEITPMRIQGPNEKCIPPVQLVKHGMEGPLNQDTSPTLDTAESIKYDPDPPMHTGIVNKTSTDEMSTVNVESGKHKPGPKSRCGINYLNTTSHQMNSTDTHREFNAEPLAKKRRIVDNADTQNSDPKHVSSLDNIGTTEKTNSHYTPVCIQTVRQKPGPKKDDIFKMKRSYSYYPAFNKRECSTISWLSKSYVAQDSPRADEALLTVDTLNKMLSLMEAKEPISLCMKKMRAAERKKLAQRQNELDGRLDEYEKRKLGMLENEKKPGQPENKESATIAKKNKCIVPIYETKLAPKPKLLTLSFCCWARSKMEYPKNKRRHRCPRICECCCRNDLLESTKWRSTVIPSSIVISDEEDNTAADSIAGAIESVVQNSREQNVPSEKLETPKDLTSTAVVPLRSQQVEASIQCDLDDNNLARSIHTDTNKVASNQLPATPPSVSTDVIAIGENEDEDKNKDPKPICEPVVPKCSIIIRKPRINVMSQNALLSPSRIKTYVPIAKKRKQHVSSFNFSKREMGDQRSPKVVYVNTKRQLESETGCPIYLGKNKILLTDVKLPSDLYNNANPPIMPLAAVKTLGVPSVEPETTAMPPTYDLPQGVQLVLQPDGKVNCILDPAANIPMATLQTLPNIIKAIEQHIGTTNAWNNSSAAVNVNNYENVEVSASIAPEDRDNSNNVNSLNNDTASVVRKDNEIATNDNINLTHSIQNNITLECNEVLKSDDTTTIQSDSDVINKQSLSTSQDNEEINPTPGEISIDCCGTLLNTLEQSNSIASKAIEESRTTSDTDSSDGIDNVSKTLEQSIEPTALQAIEETKATSEITSKVYVDTNLLTFALSNESTASQEVVESKTTSEITSIGCVDTVPETLKQSIEPATSQATEKSNPASGVSSEDIVGIASETHAQNNTPEENSDVRGSPTPEVDPTGKHESKNDNGVPNINRSTLLSDLMEMSGISAEDTTPPVNENVGVDIAVPYLVPLSQPRYLQTRVNATPVLTSSPSKNLTDFCSITSFKQLKYACEHNGNFYKMDLETGTMVPINVCIQKKPQPGQGSSMLKSVIDLTDDPALSDDEALSERPATSTSPSLSVNPAMPPILVRKNLSFINSNSEPQAFVIVKSNPTKSLLKDSYHLANSAKPLKLFKSANFTKQNQKNKVSSALSDSHPRDKQSTKNNRRKQMFDDPNRLDAESLGSNDSFDSIDNYVWSSDKYLSDSDSSDDEPLAIKSKRMKMLQTKESSVVATASDQVIEQNVDNSGNTADENIANTEANVEDGSEMTREITFMSDHEADDGNEDCILGF